MWSIFLSDTRVPRNITQLRISLTTWGTVGPFYAILRGAASPCQQPRLICSRCEGGRPLGLREATRKPRPHITWSPRPPPLVAKPRDRRGAPIQQPPGKFEKELQKHYTKCFVAVMEVSFETALFVSRNYPAEDYPPGFFL